MEHNKSFTLIEVVVATFVITLGALGAFSLIQRITAFYPIISSQLTATYLAQEGIEIVRNIRDTNWLEQRTNPGVLWDSDIPAGNRAADYKSGNLNLAYTGQFLNLDGNNFYSYSAGTPTKFKRKITISKPAANEMVVSVQVTWAERGRTHQVTAETELHNWR